MHMRFFLWLSIIFLLSACNSVYYSTMEKMGVHKRDIMMDRVKEARDAQNDAKAQFLTALDQFKSVVNFKGGDLEKTYNRLNDTLKKSEARAADVRERIRSVEEVSGALFKEWRSEIKKYTSDTLRRQSQRKYDMTLEKYETLIDAMKAAEAKLDPVLVPLRDQVLFLKHNLNARAIAGLSEELVQVEDDVERLVRDMDTAISEANRFIAALGE